MNNILLLDLLNKDFTIYSNVSRIDSKRKTDDKIEVKFLLFVIQLLKRPGAVLHWGCWGCIPPHQPNIPLPQSKKFTQHVTDIMVVSDCLGLQCLFTNYF